MIANLETMTAKTESYWILVVYKIDKTHPDVVTTDELAEVADLLDRYATTDYDYMEIYYVTNHKARLFADIKSDGVRVYQPFSDMIDYGGLINDNSYDCT